MLNTQPQHQVKEETPKVTRAFKVPTFGITDEMVQESINKVLAMSGKAAEEASRIWREQEEERKLFLNHPVTIRINKYKEQFKDDPENLKLLNGMKVIEEDELQLIDGTVVKIGYPDIKADNKEIFERIVKDTEGKEIRAIYFTNQKGGAFEKYQKEMKQKGFRIAGNENDFDGKIFQKEMIKIFDMIVKKGPLNYTTIIIDILGRALSGYRSTDGDIHGEGVEENFWSCSNTPNINVARFCYIGYTYDFHGFNTFIRNYGFGALFFRDKKSD